MTIQTCNQLMAQLAAEGLDDDELDLMQHELEMDLNADEYEEDDKETFFEDDQHSTATSSTIHISPPPSRLPPNHAPSTSTVPQKRKRLSKKKISPEMINDDEDIVGLGEHDCMLTKLV